MPYTEALQVEVVKNFTGDSQSVTAMKTISGTAAVKKNGNIKQQQVKCQLTAKSFIYGISILSHSLSVKFRHALPLQTLLCWIVLLTGLLTSCAGSLSVSTEVS